METILKIHSTKPIIIDLPKNEKLELFLRPFFHEGYTLRIHVLKDKLAIHKDFGRKKAFNYIIASGGPDVETCFYADNFKLIEKHKIDMFRWHQMDVTTYHSVINMIEPRIALTIYLEEEGAADAAQLVS